jgi:hypothetical protein
VGVSSLSQIIKHRPTCVTLWDVLREEYLPTPTTEMLLKIEEMYWRKLNFSNYVGALDGVYSYISKLIVRLRAAHFIITTSNIFQYYFKHLLMQTAS